MYNKNPFLAIWWACVPPTQHAINAWNIKHRTSKKTNGIEIWVSKQICSVVVCMLFKNTLNNKNYLAGGQITLPMKGW